MESSGSSFIPQRPTHGKVAAKSFRKVYVLSYVSYLVFFTTLLAVAGIFLYKLSLESSLKNLQQELIAQKTLFSQADLDRVEDLDKRISMAKQLVDSHASVHKILVALDQVVADPVQFLGLEYDRTEDPRQPRLILSAVAKEFNEIIFQEQILSANPITRNFEMSDVSLSTQPINPEQLELGVHEVVSVTMLAELSPAEINYTGLSVPLPPLNSDNSNPNNQSNGGQGSSQTQPITTTISDTPQTEADQGINQNVQPQ